MSTINPSQTVPSSEQPFPNPQAGFGDETIADHILGDQPAEKFSEDRLGFKPYVEAVAKFLTDESTKAPLTMSVEGLWGSGKSSFMRLLQTKLGELGKRRFVAFEAWQYSADEGLWAAFLDAFDAQLWKSLKWREKWRARYKLVKLRMSVQGAMDTVVTGLWIVFAMLILVPVGWYSLKHFRILGDMLSHFGGNKGEEISELLAAFGGVAGSMAAVLVFVSKLHELLKSPAALNRTKKLWGRPDFHDRLPLIQEMTRNLQSLIEAYAGKDETVYVFIDDLDRCEYTKAAELIQGLLLLASSAPNVALIVGLDREKVAAAMAAKQEKLLPYLYHVAPANIYAIGDDYGQRFLEKFIQVSYVLPAPRPSGLKAMINPNAPPPDTPPPPGAASVQAVRVATGKDDSHTLDALIDMANVAFDRNPRNVKQFINMFRLQAFIASETGLFENPEVTRWSGLLLMVPQLAKFVALCMRWPRFVNTALNNPNLLTELEDHLTTSYGAPKSPLTEDAQGWLSDRGLAALLSFEVDEPQFRLAGVDLRLLMVIAPARTRADVNANVNVNVPPPTPTPAPAPTPVPTPTSYPPP
ncbi:MAG TPA: P-loop NTPase fold protein [Terracidiphilus sp.]|jgi:hypothetical protein